MSLWGAALASRRDAGVLAAGVRQGDSAGHGNAQAPKIAHQSSSFLVRFERCDHVLCAQANNKIGGGALRGIALALGKAALAVLLIYGLSKSGALDFRSVGGLWSNGVRLLISALLLLGGILVSGVRWALLLRAAKLHLKTTAVLQLQLIGSLFSNCLPGAAGGDAIRAVYLFRLLPTNRTTALVALIVDRLFSLVGLVMLAAIMVLANIQEIAAHPVLGFYARLVAGVLAAAAIVVCVLYILALRFQVPITSVRWIERFRPLGRQLRTAIIVYGQRWKTLAACTLLSIVASGTVVLGIVVLSGAFDFAPATRITALAGTLGNISSAVPLTPGGIGIGEAMFGRVCADLGSISAPFATIYLAFRVTMAIVSLSGFLAYLSFDPKRYRSAIASASRA
jgi:uncharacterized protein (TIRG00374 family)